MCPEQNFSSAPSSEGYEFVVSEVLAGLLTRERLDKIMSEARVNEDPDSD